MIAGLWSDQNALSFPLNNMMTLKQQSYFHSSGRGYHGCWSPDDGLHTRNNDSCEKCDYTYIYINVFIYNYFRKREAFAVCKSEWI